MTMHESGEMYLETILVLSRRQSAVRSIDVAEEMGFSKPSVSRAVNKLKDGGFLTVAGDGALTLTEKGRAVAEKIYERHTVLTALLMALGVDEANAAADACKMEHDISDETFAAMKKHLKKRRTDSD